MVKAPDFDSGIRRFESFLLCQFFGRLAQLVERRLDKADVAGSSPAVTTTVSLKQLREYKKCAIMKLLFKLSSFAVVNAGVAQW